MNLSRRRYVTLAILYGIAALGVLFFSRSFSHQVFAAPSPAPTTNAADLYLKAVSLISVDCPAASDLEYPEYPPYGPKWESLAQAAWEKNAAAPVRARSSRRASGKLAHRERL